MRAITFDLEQHRHLKPMHRLQVLIHDPFWLHDLGKFRNVVVLGACRRMHREPPQAARPKVKVRKRVREPLWPPPLRKLLRISKGLVDSIAWSGEHAAADDLSRMGL